MDKILKAIFFCLLFLAGLTVKADIIFPAFISDGMVLQQQTNAPLWGKTSAGNRVTVVTSWNNKEYVTESDNRGYWKLRVETPGAGGPYSITFKEENNSITLQDILIGEVWLCSGQSNMEMPMKGFKNQPVENANMDILKSANPRIRLFTVKRNSTLAIQEDVTGEWAPATPASVKEFSATGYYFGRLLQEILDVPVGLVCASWGGSWIEGWMGTDMLQSFPEVRLPEKESDIREKNRTPTTLYNAMISPLVGFSIRGVIWYQGESNYDRYHNYTDLFKTMVDGWRSKWDQGPFPFYYCQIAPYDYALVTPEGEEVINSAYLREAQLNAERAIENSGMVVLLDAGSEKGIHPAKKQVPGERLALQALAKTYKIEGITADSPVYKEMEIRGDTVILSFDRTDMWITALNGELNHFTIAGSDRQFHKAEAWISRSKVYVKADMVKEPVAVRYAFENYVEGDLFGTEGLPVSSFRTDNW